MFKTFRIGAEVLLLAVVVAYAPAALALGLGNASVDSYLNQPLQARIELIVRETDDFDSISASLASAEDFALIGASREAISVPLRFALERDGETAFIRVSSNLPVKDPVIRLIVEVNWSSGRMLREYTLFLDPPTFSSPAPSPVVDDRDKPPVAAAAPVQPVAPPAQSGEVSDDSAPVASVSAETGGAEHGPVQAGETLWRIASNWSQGTGLDMNKVMIAIQRNNPQAFINGNINLLKRGVILRMPQVDEIEEIPAGLAREEVSQQRAALDEKVTPPAVDTPLVDQSSESLVLEDEETPQEPEDMLELVPPSEVSDVDSAYGFEESAEQADASTSVEALREELARTEEELIVEQQTNQDLQDRIAELEGLLAVAREGNVEDTELARLEGELSEARLAEAGNEEVSQPEPASPEEASPAVPQVRTSAGERNESPWYSSFTTWLIGLLVLGAAVGGWFFSRRDAEPVLVSSITVAENDTVHEIRDEAEEILKVLEPTDEAPITRTATNVEEAEILDEESADPEVRLDLARAYIAMGDKEAARVILAEVIEHGSEEQKAEANAMLGGF